MWNTPALLGASSGAAALGWHMPSTTAQEDISPATALAAFDEDEAPVEWSEEDIVLLHWRLLKEIGRLADPEAPLEEKLDTLRWVLTERDKDDQPFSFASCLRVVGCSPLSPLPYCGLIDAEEVRERIRHAAKAWLLATLERYPAWVRDAVVHHPEWVEAQLARNPQWINEEVRRIAAEGDLFAGDFAGMDHPTNLS